jgi:hypothetical protein
LAATDRRGADETGSEDKTGAIAPDDNGEGEKPSSLCPPIPLDKLRRETRKTRPTLKIDQSDLATQTTSWRRRQNSWRQNLTRVMRRFPGLDAPHEITRRSDDDILMVNRLFLAEHGSSSSPLKNGDRSQVLVSLVR